MNRPKRIYKAPNGRFYYLVKGVRKFLKVAPNKKKFIIKTKKKIPPRKKPATKRKKTAFALNPQSVLQAPPQVGLPTMIPVEQKPIVGIQDVAKQEITKKNIEIAKQIKDEEEKKRTLEGSIRPNYKVKRTIDTLFQRYKDITGYDNVSDIYAWKKFQKTKEYNNPIKEDDDDNIYSIKAPYLYNYEPKLKDKGKKVSKKDSEDEDEDTESDVSTDPSIGKLLKKDFLDSDSESLIAGRGPSGLFNTDIEDIMKGLKNICPVIPSDKIGMLLDYVKEGMGKFGAIINTNPSKSDGSGTDGFRTGHWRAIFFDNDDDYVSAEYFDPLCEGPIPAPLKAMMKKIAKKMNPEDYALVKENNLKRQMDTTNTCGYHAIKFIDDRYNDVPWSQATGYDDYMAKHKPDDSEAGEKSLVKPIKKYDKYI